MDESLHQDAPLIEEPQPGRFSWAPLACWLPVCGALGALVAWAADVARGYSDPFLVFPLIVGIVLGGVAVILMRVCRVGHRPTILLGVLLAATLTALGQHYVHFERIEWRMSRDPKAALKRLALPEELPPPDFWEFMRWSAAKGLPIGKWPARDAWAWLVWGVDALCVYAPALLLVMATARLPYCNRCRSWYRTIRSGRIEPALARRLAAAIDLPVAENLRSARYRLCDCPSGCGPTGFTLSLDQPEGDFSSGLIWLDVPQRNEVQAILDRPAMTEEGRPTQPGPGP